MAKQTYGRRSVLRTILLCSSVLLSLDYTATALNLGEGVILGVKDAFNKCKGLNIASMSKTQNFDVMKDGAIVHPWDGIPQANLATADEYDRQFYISKNGVPLYFNNVTVHHANPYMKHRGSVIKPTLQKDLGQSIIDCYNAGSSLMFTNMSPCFANYSSYTYPFRQLRAGFTLLDYSSILLFC